MKQSLRKDHRQDQLDSAAKPERNHILKYIEAKTAYKVETRGESYTQGELRQDTGEAPGVSSVWVTHEGAAPLEFLATSLFTCVPLVLSKQQKAGTPTTGSSSKCGARVKRQRGY